MTQILVVKPGTLTAGDKRKLRAAGVVAVETERPEDVRLIGTEGPPMTNNDMVFAALQAMAKPGGSGWASDARSMFVTLLSEISFENRKAEKANEPSPPRTVTMGVAP